MKIIEEVVVSLTWSDLENLTYHERKKHKRSSGVHVKSIIDWLAGPEGLGLYKERADTEDMPLGVLLGMGFEEVAARLYSTMHWQPGELELDGVFGSPDGFDDVELDGLYILVVDEFKRTLMSRWSKGGGDGRSSVIEIWPWMAQMMAYHKMKWPDSQEPGFGRLHVDWDAGDYRPPCAEYRRYLIRFERVEIENNWKLLVKYKDRAAAEVH